MLSGHSTLRNVRLTDAALLRTTGSASSQHRLSVDVHNVEARGEMFSSLIALYNWERGVIDGVTVVDAVLRDWSLIAIDGRFSRGNVSHVTVSNSTLRSIVNADGTVASLNVDQVSARGCVLRYAVTLSSPVVALRTLLLHNCTFTEYGVRIEASYMQPHVRSAALHSVHVTDAVFTQARAVVRAVVAGTLQLGDVVITEPHGPRGAIEVRCMECVSVELQHVLVRGYNATSPPVDVRLGS